MYARTSGLWSARPHSEWRSAQAKELTQHAWPMNDAAKGWRGWRDAGEPGIPRARK